jgi:dTDP-4-dehydrorhamnose 3,5-epimerase
MRVTKLDLEGLLLVELDVHRDERGFFVERFNLDRFHEHGLLTAFVQDNHSRSLPGVLRGLHYQYMPAQSKLVGVLRGRIWDVAVDLRPDSPTFGKSACVELSDWNGRLLCIPTGFAHGFCVLGDEPADVLYKVDAAYNPHGEKGILWSDPDLAIDWPIANPIVSARDQHLSSFAEYCANLVNWAPENAPAEELLVHGSN